MVSNSTTTLTEVIQHLNYADALRATIILLVGWFLAKGARLLVTRILGQYFHNSNLITLQRIAYYTVFMLFLVSALRQIGFNLGVLLGAAGIFTVAFGFASQTSVSNLISGLFLLAERSFFIGDTIKVNGAVGKVLSIDLLSTKIRMDDNTYMRIPNELLIKSQIANLSRFPTRRSDIPLIISAEADFNQAIAILLDIANHEALVLKDPKPAVNTLELYDYGVKVQLLVWGKLADGALIKHRLISQIKQRFTENQIALSRDKTILIIGGKELVNGDR